MLKIAKKVIITILMLIVFYNIVLNSFKIVQVKKGEDGELITYKFFVLEYQYYIEY